MPPALCLRGAVALAGRFPALAGVDLVAEPGEVVVLAGANGAGKTSVLRVLAGLLPLSGGEGQVLGVDLRSDRRQVRHLVGMVGHAAALYDELTVEENVRFALRAARGDLGRVGLALEVVGLGGRLRRTPAGRLSAGQRRRVDLAVLVARRPALWLLDEPHASLDQAGRALVDRVIKDAAAGGATVVVASHELSTVVPMADQVVTLGGGRVLEVWRPEGWAEGGAGATSQGQDEAPVVVAGGPGGRDVA
ncbi:heme ABC exporter ATP-binding protein CcmA [Aciditerrimonas ferrireducens]|jgi:heme ABC exporter ATP-binding subunit CcmA|uniref:Heme ABC exporter ATP-binding protein CcmA n=1 Tax=Aciditerrimonas ferrireducens TaxID=667306 RepID=A0ABV6C2Y4_9ACTN|nr:heme ABC exporter ATP-binding protein CcmA [Aciditerrimonas ferrireducens]MCK4177023.1 heme ABC exporter ATP-binding protein CcmA [Aciditerrimonas ferrireducens]